MAKRIPGGEEHYDPVSQKFLAELASPSPAAAQASPVRQLPALAAGTPLKLRSREKRVLLDAEEDVLIEAQVQRLAAELGTPLKLSHVLRAYLALFRRAEPHLLARARQAGPLSRPSNGDLEALSRFEDEVAGLLVAALRDLPHRP
jgi:hypothetical protein